jgi:type I restriction enzyme S subunit
MHHYTIHCDYETSERVGAGGMFQVVSLTDQNGVDCTDLVNVGKHYRSLPAVKKDIATKIKKKLSEIELDEE